MKLGGWLGMVIASSVASLGMPALGFFWPEAEGTGANVDGTDFVLPAECAADTGTCAGALAVSTIGFFVAA